MNFLLVISAVVCLAIVAVGPIRDFTRRERDLLSMRNFFLLGFAFFYLIASVLYSFGGGNPNLYVAIGTGATVLAFLIPVFLVMYYAGEYIGKRLGWFTKLLPRAEIAPSTPSLWATIGIFCFLGVVALLIGGSVRAEGRGFTYTQVLALQFRNAFAATAMGLATYYLLARRFNPISWAVFGFVLIAATIITTAGGAGRRNWIAVLLAIPWMWWYVSLRYRPLGPAIVKMSIPVAVGFVFLLAYTGIRHEAGQRASAEERIGQLKQIVSNVQITERAADIVFMQDTPQNTVFIIENYPELYARKPLIGLIYVLGTPIPRYFWPNKPEALGIEIMEHMNANATLAPGIIGHGWAEAGVIGVVYYAVFFGAFVVLIDMALRERLHNPFFVAAMGTALGNMVAMARGDTPLFMVQVLAGWVAVFGVLFIIKLVIGPVAAGFPPVLVPLPQQGPAHDEWDEDFGDYGPDEDGDGWDIDPPSSSRLPSLARAG